MPVSVVYGCVICLLKILNIALKIDVDAESEMVVLRIKHAQEKIMCQYHGMIGLDALRTGLESHLSEAG